MTVEILFYDYLLFGDAANADYIKRCLPEARFVYTSVGDTPYFAENEPDLIYMGGMSENNLERSLNALKGLRDRLLSLADKGVHMLFTANACDILGREIINGEKRTQCLNIFDFTVEMDMLRRKNSMVLGSFGDMQIVGYKSHFGTVRLGSEKNFFMKTERGTGLCEGCGYDGFKRGGLIATYILGPLLITNPLFTKAYLGEIAGREVILPFEEEAVKAYEIRLSEFKDPARKIV